MRTARRHPARSLPWRHLCRLMLTGCTVAIIDPAADDPRLDPHRRMPRPLRRTRPHPAPRRAKSRPQTRMTRTRCRARPSTASVLIAAATTTMTCPPGPLDEDGAIIRVEGPCAELVIDIDAGVVIVDDVDELLLRGSGTVVYAGTIGDGDRHAEVQTRSTGPARRRSRKRGSANSLGGADADGADGTPAHPARRRRRGDHRRAGRVPRTQRVRRARRRRRPSRSRRGGARGSRPRGLRRAHAPRRRAGVRPPQSGVGSCGFPSSFSRRSVSRGSAAPRSTKVPTTT